MQSSRDSVVTSFSLKPGDCNPDPLLVFRCHQAMVSQTHCKVPVKHSSLFLDARNASQQQFSRHLFAIAFTRTAAIISSVASRNNRASCIPHQADSEALSTCSVCCSKFVPVRMRRTTRTVLPCRPLFQDGEGVCHATMVPALDLPSSITRS